jgi:hypothetical protein
MKASCSIGAITVQLITGPISVGKILALNQLIEIDPVFKMSCLKKLKVMDNVHVYCYIPSSETFGISSMSLFI